MSLSHRLSKEKEKFGTKNITLINYLQLFKLYYIIKLCIILDFERNDTH